MPDWRREQAEPVQQPGGGLPSSGCNALTMLLLLLWLFVLFCAFSLCLWILFGLKRCAGQCSVHQELL